MFRRPRRVGARAFALFIGLGTCGALGAGCSDAEPEVDEIEFGTVRSRLEAVATFGTNPGQLTMKKYVPDGMPNTPRNGSFHRSWTRNP